MFVADIQQYEILADGARSMRASTRECPHRQQ